MYCHRPSRCSPGSRGLWRSRSESSEKRAPTSTRPFSTFVSKRSSGRTGGAPAPPAPNRGATGHRAVEAVAPAVARVDEALRGLDVADRAARVGTARAHGDVRLTEL